MKLHFRTYGEGKPLVILHGLFGSSDNWQTLGKKFGEDFKVYLIDQRNHGRSDKSDEFSYELMLSDLHEFFRDNQIKDAILVGHSMGGKTAILFAQQYPELVEKIVVVDIGVKEYPMHHDHILAGLNSIDLNVVTSRKEVESILSEYVSEFGTRQFLLKNLYWEEKGKLGWRINIPVLGREIENIIGALPLIKVSTPTLFIRGELSNYILDSDFTALSLQFPDSRIETVVGAGHWIHAEAPTEFYKLIMDFVNE